MKPLSNSLVFQIFFVLRKLLNTFSFSILGWISWINFGNCRKLSTRTAKLWPTHSFYHSIFKIKQKIDFWEGGDFCLLETQFFKPQWCSKCLQKWFFPSWKLFCFLEKKFQAWFAYGWLRNWSRINFGGLGSQFWGPKNGQTRFKQNAEK